MFGAFLQVNVKGQNGFKDTLLNIECRHGSTVFCGCFAVGRTGALHQVDDIARKEHIKTSARVLNLGSK